MPSEERGVQDEQAGERRRREQALHELAGGQIGGEERAPKGAGTNGGGALSPRPPSREKRRWLIAGLVLVVVVAGVGGSVALHGRSGVRAVATATPQPPRVLQLLANSVECLEDFAWSPDGKRLATLLAVEEVGTTGHAAVTTMVTVYDCASGKVLATLTPSAANGPDMNGLVPDTLMWSPDGSHLLA
jgi:hypothetical protein